jgi:hypothetical protein
MDELSNQDTNGSKVASSDEIGENGVPATLKRKGVAKLSPLKKKNRGKAVAMNATLVVDSDAEAATLS